MNLIRICFGFSTHTCMYLMTININIYAKKTSLVIWKTNAIGTGTERLLKRGSYKERLLQRRGVQQRSSYSKRLLQRSSYRVAPTEKLVQRGPLQREACSSFYQIYKKQQNF